VNDPSKNVNITTFPSFSIQQGKMLGGKIGTPGLSYVYSPQLNNSRNISVYVPQSVLQNTIPRKVNIMLMMDGEFEVTAAMAFQGGFELAVMTSVVPESILIGVPSNPNLLLVNPSGDDHGANERTFEYTFAVCNATLMDCNPATSGYTVLNTGGTDLLLDFISDIVIPTVLEVIGNFTAGEVSIFFVHMFYLCFSYSLLNFISSLTSLSIL
jgi:hypothetical protein